VDHIFPRSELRRKGVDEDLINDVANFWILTQGKNRNKSNRRPKDYFADVGTRQLKNALIDPELLDYRQYKRFIATRREAVIERIEAILGVSDMDLSVGSGGNRTAVLVRSALWSFAEVTSWREAGRCREHMRRDVGQLGAPSAVNNRVTLAVLITLPLRLQCRVPAAASVRGGAEGYAAQVNGSGAAAVVCIQDAAGAHEAGAEAEIGCGEVH